MKKIRSEIEELRDRKLMDFNKGKSNIHLLGRNNHMDQYVLMADQLEKPFLKNTWRSWWTPS